MIQLTEIKEHVYELETKLMTTGSNSDTFELFALIGMYQFLGGKEDLVMQVRHSGLLNKFDNERAKMNYVSNMVNYTTASEIYLALVYPTLNKVHQVKKRNGDLYLPDVVHAIRQKAPSTLKKYGIELEFEGLYTLKIRANTNGASSSNIQTVLDVKELVPEFIRRAFRIQLEPYMLETLNKYAATILVGRWQ